jgi:hypothetical protein
LVLRRFGIETTLDALDDVLAPATPWVLMLPALFFQPREDEPMLILDLLKSLGRWPAQPREPPSEELARALATRLAYRAVLMKPKRRQVHASRFGLLATGTKERECDRPREERREPVELLS